MSNQRFLPSEMSVNNIKKYLNTVHNNIPTEENNTYKNLNKYANYSKRVQKVKKALDWFGSANANVLRNTFSNNSYKKFKPFLSEQAKTKISFGELLKSTPSISNKQVKTLKALNAGPRFTRRANPHRVGGLGKTNRRASRRA